MYLRLWLRVEKASDFNLKKNKINIPSKVEK